MSSTPATPRPRAGRRTVAALLVAGGGLVAASCSGGGISLSSWRTKADDVCATVQKEADQVRPVLFTPTLADTMRKSAELSKKETSQLRDLEKPDEKRAEVRDYLGSLDERNRQLELQANLLGGSDPGSQPSFDELAKITAQAASQAQALGMQKCRAGVDMSVGGSSSSSTSSTAPGAGGPTTTLEPVSPNPEDPNGFGTQDG